MVINRAEIDTIEPKFIKIIIYELQAKVLQAQLAA